MVAKKKPTAKLKLVPPEGLPKPAPPTVAEQRAAARQAVKELREGLRHLEAARFAYIHANALAGQHKLPGTRVMVMLDVDGNEVLDPGDWPGVHVVTDKADRAMHGATRKLQREIRDLKNRLLRFLRETKEAPP